jgi:hypothetical protein
MQRHRCQGHGLQYESKAFDDQYAERCGCLSWQVLCAACCHVLLDIAGGVRSSSAVAAMLAHSCRAKALCGFYSPATHVSAAYTCHMTLLAGVYTGATSQLGHAAHSRTFLIFGAIATCAHVVMWVVVICLTAVNAWSGRLFHAPCLSHRPASQQAAGAAAELQLELLRVASKVEEQLQQPATPGDAAQHANGAAGDGSMHGAAACCVTDDEEAVLGGNSNRGSTV